MGKENETITTQNTGRRVCISAINPKSNELYRDIFGGEDEAGVCIFLAVARVCRRLHLLLVPPVVVATGGENEDEWQGNDRQKREGGQSSISQLATQRAYDFTCI